MPKPRKTDSDVIATLLQAGKKKFVRYKEGALLYSMGLHKFQVIAMEAGAVYHVQGIVLVNTELVDAYLEKFHDKPAEE